MAQPLADTDHKLIEAICARYREWAPLESARPQPAERLEAGLSNRSILLRGSSSNYVLRVANENPPPGVDRVREQAFSSAAAAAGLAPPLLYCDPDRGVQVTAFRGEALRAAPTPATLAQLLHRIHDMEVAMEFSKDARSSAWQLQRHLDMPGQSTSLYRLLGTCDPAIRSAVDMINSSDATTVPCHNDLLAANLRTYRSSLIALDWEYAAPGDPFFDLAVCASDRSLVPNADTLLCTYLGRQARPEEQERFTAQRVVYSAIACCWYDRYAPASDAAGSAAQALRMLSEDFGGTRRQRGEQP